MKKTEKETDESTTEKAEQKTGPVSVLLLKPHSHLGVYYDEAAIKAGVTIQITPAQQASLSVQGVV